MERKVLISGKVQGVFYRSFIKKKADELGVRGWVKNLDDGRVEAVFCGPRKRVSEMIKSCWKGSLLSRVERVEEADAGKKEKFAGFEIRY